MPLVSLSEAKMLFSVELTFWSTKNYFCFLLFPVLNSSCYFGLVIPVLGFLSKWWRLEVLPFVPWSGWCNLWLILVILIPLAFLDVLAWMGNFKEKLFAAWVSPLFCKSFCAFWLNSGCFAKWWFSAEFSESCKDVLIQGSTVSDKIFVDCGVTWSTLSASNSELAFPIPRKVLKVLRSYSSGIR